MLENVNANVTASSKHRAKVLQRINAPAPLKVRQLLKLETRSENPHETVKNHKSRGKPSHANGSADHKRSRCRLPHCTASCRNALRMCVRDTTKATQGAVKSASQPLFRTAWITFDGIKCKKTFMTITSWTASPRSP